MKYKWTKVEQKASVDIKRVVVCNTLSAHPDLNKKIKIHNYASDFQLGVVIGQKGKPIDFYSINITTPQRSYKVT